MSGNEKLRLEAIARFARILGEAHANFDLRSGWPTCLNCVHWDTSRELCKLNGCRPPATIIVNGCECYDDIPF